MMKIVKSLAIFFILIGIALSAINYFVMFEGDEVTELNVSKQPALSYISEFNYCREDVDCINLGSHCPVGCNLLVNVDNEVAARERLASLTRGTSTGTGCIYSGCPNDGYLVKCHRSVCVMASDKL